MSFIDLFSGHAEHYAAARPRYPRALFDQIAAWSPGLERAWDVGTGNRQAALGLAERFGLVLASDPSEPQIARAVSHPRVRYSVQPAEATSYEDASFDAVCVAQALHWFDHARFYPEVRRVAKPGAVFVAVGYDWLCLGPALDEVLTEVIVRPVEKLWAPEIAHLWAGYRTIPFPFDRLDSPPFRLEFSWSLTELLAYVHTWSAVQRKLREDGPGFFEHAGQRLAEVWGAVETLRAVEIPLHVLAGRVGYSALGTS